MWLLLEYLVMAAIVLLSITEFFYPLLTNKPFFGSFRKRQPEVAKPKQAPSSLKEKVNKAKEKVQEVKDIQQEIDKNFKSAEQLKEESDNLMNNQNN